MTRLQFLRKHRKKIQKLAAKHGAYNVRLFGSVVREEETSESDIDVLVKLKKGKSFFDLMGFKIDLEDMCNCSVDVIHDKGVPTNIRDQVFSSAIAI